MNFENLISLTDAIKLIPSRPAFSTVWRWCAKGRKTQTGQRIRLKYIVIGRKKHTTVEWLFDFFNKCAEEEFKYFDGQQTFSRVRKQRLQKKTITNRDSSQEKAYEALRQHGIDV